MEWQKQGKFLEIRQHQEKTIKRLEKDTDKLQHVYDLGIKNGKESIERVKNYLAE